MRPGDDRHPELRHLTLVSAGLSIDLERQEPSRFQRRSSPDNCKATVWPASRRWSCNRRLEGLDDDEGEVPPADPCAGRVRSFSRVDVSGRTARLSGARDLEPKGGHKVCR